MSSNMSFFRDLKIAFHSLMRSKGLAAIVILTLALGIGANAAIFGLIDHVMLRMLPVKNPQDLLVIRATASYPRFEEMRKRNSAFASMFGVHVMRVPSTLRPNIMPPP